MPYTCTCGEEFATLQGLDGHAYHEHDGLTAEEVRA